MTNQNLLLEVDNIPRKTQVIKQESFTLMLRTGIKFSLKYLLLYFFDNRKMTFRTQDIIKIINDI